MLGTFAYLASIGLVAALLVEPSGLSSAASLAAAKQPLSASDIAGQSLLIDEVATQVAAETAARDGFEVVKSKPKPTAATAPAVGVPDPGTAQAIAYDMVVARGWGQSEFDCLVALWNKESHWNVYAHNTRSGAYGIPQALPGEKMASAGDDWATNPTTQIVWGLGYIQGRYGSPCVAWGNSQTRGWY
ncbi:MAG: lytic transglycosylase domain-containing protein [Leifsonia xyli]|nr:MAG: lytic transglycosylase domain-containing protein [Leifsonia xyli]